MTTLSDDQIRKQFPTWSWLLNNPEIHAILADPDKYATSDQVQAAIEQTNWWKTTQPSLRTYDQLQQQDPEALAEQQRQKEADIWDMYQKAGLNPPQSDVQTLATQALQLGWNSSQLNDAIMQHAQYSPDVTKQAGSIQTSMAGFKQAASQYGVTLDDPTAYSWAVQVAKGEKTDQDYTPVLQQWATSRYPALAQQIQSGVTVQQYFAPYQQEVGKLLEKPAGSVDLINDPKYSQVVDYADPKTGERRPMTLAETQSFVRSSDAWRGTQQGQQAGADMTEGLLNMFGKVSSGVGSLAGPANTY